VKFLASLLIAGLLGTTTASAETAREAKREENQEQRIQEGAASGSINAEEQAKLDAHQARIDGAEAKAEADGKVTKKEKAKIERMQDRRNRSIVHKKHNKR
jgi:hypothetical protein